MASNVSNKHLTEFEEGPTPRKHPALNGNAVSRPTTPGTHEESDDGSVVEIFGDQGEGADSLLCTHCQHICDNWSEGCNRNFAFPHYGNIFQLEESVTGGCTMCAQFLQSQSSDEIQRAKDETKLHWPASFGSGVSFSILEYPTSEYLHLKFLLPPSSDMDSDLEDDFVQEIIGFHVDLVPITSSGKDL